jgi:hypothetical protein
MGHQKSRNPTHTRSAALVFWLAASLTLISDSARSADPMQLITPAEAALPPGAVPSFEVRGVVVTYIKKPDIDITARIESFITADGIDIAQAAVPPGQHQFWIEVKDTDGRIAGREVDFQVLK